MKTYSELEEQNKALIEALDKINSLGLDDIHEGPRIAADILDVVQVVGGEF